MQAGHHRQALGFAAHTAGEHPKDAACLAAYLWLLRLGGQDEFARQVWSPASQFNGSDADGQLLQALRDAWSVDWPQALGRLRQAPLRLAPYAHGQSLPSTARVVASGTLVRDAQGVQRAIVPASLLSSGAPQRWWVRNGLGLTVVAHPDATAPGGLVAALRLDAVMPGSASLAPRDAFPGSQAYAFAHALGQATGDAPATASEAALALAAWPVMRMGFAGPLHPQLGRLLGVEVAAGSNPLGGPVLDAQGRLTGVSLASIDTPNRLVPASLLLGRGWAANSAAPEPSATRLPSDALYELGLSSTLQIIHDGQAQGELGKADA